MTTHRTYPHGATCWVDTGQPDVDAASRFYAGLFGWELTDATPPEAPGAYLIARLDGKDVAAIGPTSADVASWNTYVAVDDADATAAAVEDGGGAVVDPPAEAGPAGRAATVVDPAGVRFHLWQARRRLGAQYVNGPGGWVFSDLLVPDRVAAMAFYRPLFGWRGVDLPRGGGSMLQLPGYGDHLAATVDPDIHERQASAPEGFADVTAGFAEIGADDVPRWHVTFSVADRDEGAATAERLGATVVSTSENPWTRDAVLRDPQGAVLSISQFAPQDW